MNRNLNRFTIVLILIFSFCLESFCQETILFPKETTSGLEFGYSVAAFNDYVVVGALRGNPNFNLAGSAYVFRKNGENWVEEAKLLPYDSNVEQQFSFSISAYGDQILLGAPGDDDNGLNSGSAYIFSKVGNDWTQHAKLTPSDGSENERTGFFVSLYGDYALVGSPWDNVNGLTNSCSAYLFKYNGSEWVEETKLMPSDATFSAQFGISVALHDNYAIIGANRATHNNIKSGAAYVFRKNGDDWVEEVKLFPSDGSDNDGFGSSVSAQENVVLISSTKGGDGLFERGAAYMFRKNGNVWLEEIKLTPNDETEDDLSSISSSISGDLLAIALKNNTITGSVHLFQKQGSEWIDKLKIIPSNHMEYDRFGRNVFLTENYAVMGASHSEVGGRAYVYELDVLLTNEELTSINEKIKIFPNPAQNTINISGLEDCPLSKVSVYDVFGNQLFISKISDNRFRVPDFPAGIYFLKIDSCKRTITKMIYFEEY